MKRPETLDALRLAAARILLDWRKGVDAADRLVASFEADREDRGRPLDLPQRRRLRELVFSCVRLRGRYDHLIEALSRRPCADRVRVSLWLGLHELLELSTPDHAAVSQSVALVRRLGMEHAAGFVNSLLRRVAREGPDAFFPRREVDPLGWASTWLSHPRWMVERWMRRWTVEEVLALCAANNRRPPVVVRCVPGRRDEVLAAARRREWELQESELAPDGVVVRSPVPPSVVLRELPGAAAVQDEAAQLVAPLLAGAGSGIRRMIDLCAAPGGKSLHLADLLPETPLVAADRSPERLDRLRSLLDRRGTARWGLVVADGIHPPFTAAGFDGVLLDAPCTGTGVLARRHEARWRRRLEDLEELPRRQRELLHSAVDLCAVGGIIVYSTCSLEPEENDEVVDEVLRERNDLVELTVEGRVDPRVIDGRRLRVMPHRHGTDGAFAAVLSRREIPS